jgi:hypothetical protein
MENVGPEQKEWRQLQQGSLPYGDLPGIRFV